MRRRVAEAVLGRIDEGGFVKCPGQAHHTGRTARKDCRVRLDGAPTVFCVHTSCLSAVEEVNGRLRREIAIAESAAERGERTGPRVLTGLEGCASAPRAEQGPKVPPYDAGKLVEFAAGYRRGEVSLDWLAERSPVPVPTAKEQEAGPRETADLFLNTLYRKGDRVLIFTRYFSQGDWLVEVGGENLRLGDKPGVASVPSLLPTGAGEGIWFLTAPCEGVWKPVPDLENPRMGRRHEACVTRFPFILLESDHAPEALWLRALMLIPLPVVALYSSGGKSIHALVSVDCASKAEFDQCRDVLRAVLCPLGADGAAMTAVRLSRLPGCLRFGKRQPDGYKRYDRPRLQRLVYLNPSPEPGLSLVDLLK